MNKRSTAMNGTARSSGSYARCGQMSKTVSDANHVSLRAQNKDSKERQGQGSGPRVRPLSTVSPSNVTPHSHQRRWSVDYCKCGSPPVILVVKNKKEPQPPQRGASLLRPHTGSHSSFKRYSCPPIGTFTSPSQSSSSSSSTTSSCSSPPPVKTSVITGPDPLGWKLRPKSSGTSARARNRLSLQVPIPVIPAPSTPSPDPTPKTKPALMPKPLRRHHSESSAFLISLRNPLPAVTLQELCAVNLRPVTLSDGSDDVFSEGTREEKSSPSQPCKIPPPVPEKTAMARQIAQLIAHSRKRCKPVPAKSNEEENIYTTMRKVTPKYSQETVGHNSTHATKTAGLNRNIGCDRKRSTPHFPGRETREKRSEECPNHRYHLLPGCVK